MTRLPGHALFLDDTAPVPILGPFTRQQALSDGVSRRWLDAAARDGLLVSPVRGVLHASQLADTLELRLACLELVVPEDCIVTDRTAAWLWGAPMALAPNDHLRTPPVSMFRAPGNRLRGPLVASGERSFLPGEVVEVGGVRVTSPTRTVCDLGMKLPRTQAFEAMCATMRVCSVDREEVLRLAERRFVHYRWVRQLRGLAPHLDGRFQSPGECALALRWLDEVTLPPYEPQLEVPGPHGSFFLDLGVIGLPYAAEYDGAAWHGPDQAEADTARRSWIADELGIVLDVFVDHDVYGQQQCAGQRLRRGIAEARRRAGSRRT